MLAVVAADGTMHAACGLRIIIDFNCSPLASAPVTSRHDACHVVSSSSSRTCYFAVPRRMWHRNAPLLSSRGARRVVKLLYTASSSLSPFHSHTTPPLQTSSPSSRPSSACLTLNGHTHVFFRFLFLPNFALSALLFTERDFIDLGIWFGNFYVHSLLSACALLQL